MLPIDCRNNWKELTYRPMGPRRKTVDLALALDDPIEARKYIAGFKWNQQFPPKYIVWGLDEKIHFDRMTDAEAVFAAKMILRDVQMPLDLQEAELVRGLGWEH